MALGLFKKGIKAPSVPVALPSPTADDTFGTTDKKRAEGVDGRSLRATGRTEQFATKVSAGFKDRMKKAARKRGIGQNALLEDMLTVWEAQQPPGTADAEAERLRALPLWATDDVVQGMQQLAEVLKMTPSALLEDMLAERIQKLTMAGRLVSK